MFLRLAVALVIYGRHSLLLATRDKAVPRLCIRLPLHIDDHIAQRPSRKEPLYKPRPLHPSGTYHDSLAYPVISVT